jgi:Glycosyl transferase family 2
MAKIDIVIPCYNYGHLLEACVSSVLKQSVHDVRVLIIDDASQDDSLLVANRIARADQRVSIISHGQNLGHISTYNEGISWASAKFFLLLSADDLLVPGALERAAEIMDTNTDVVLTHGIGISWYSNSPLPEAHLEKSYTWTRHDLIGEMCAIGGNTVSTPTAIARTCIQKDIGNYRASLPHSADMEMWLRFAARGSVARINAPQAIYRKHPLAMSNSYISEAIRDYEQCKDAFDAFFGSCGEPLVKSHILQTRARRALANRAFRSGTRSLRRGRVNSGFSLLTWSMDADPRLRYFPPLWQLLRFPGVEGREWALSAARKAVGKAFGRT